MPTLGRKFAHGFQQPPRGAGRWICWKLAHWAFSMGSRGAVLVCLAISAGILGHQKCQIRQVLVPWIDYVSIKEFPFWEFSREVKKWHKSLTDRMEVSFLGNWQVKWKFLFWVFSWEAKKWHKIFDRWNENFLFW